MCGQSPHIDLATNYSSGKYIHRVSIPKNNFVNAMFVRSPIFSCEASNVTKSLVVSTSGCYNIQICDDHVPIWMSRVWKIHIRLVVLYLIEVATSKD